MVRLLILIIGAAILAYIDFKLLLGIIIGLMYCIVCNIIDE